MKELLCEVTFSELNLPPPFLDEKNEILEWQFNLIVRVLAYMKDNKNFIIKIDQENLLIRIYEPEELEQPHASFEKLNEG